jgi:uncharacterized Tic20 family protein
MEKTETAPASMSSSDERTWALLANLSILLNLITGILGPVVALVIYFIFKDRSRYVAYQSLQSFLFQLVFWAGAGVLAGILWGLGLAASVILIGLCLLPLACLLSVVPLGALVYGVIGAVETSQGKPFDYWLVGQWAANILGEEPNMGTVVAVQEVDDVETSTDDAGVGEAEGTEE